MSSRARITLLFGLLLSGSLCGGNAGADGGDDNSASAIRLYKGPTATLEADETGGAFTLPEGLPRRWKAHSASTWITLGPAKDGAQPFEVSPNAGPHPRQGIVYIGGQPRTIIQRHPGSYALYAKGHAFRAAGGAHAVFVLANPGSKAPTATSNDAWITIAAIDTSKQTTRVQYQVAANPGAMRTGTMTIAGQTFTVRQLAAGTPIPISGSYRGSLSRFDDVVTDIMTTYDIPGAALAVEYKGRLVLARGYGYANLETLEPVQPDSLFALASISKHFTAQYANTRLDKSELVFDGILSDLEPPPGLAKNPDLAAITVGHLINHQAGWLLNTPLGDPALTPSTIVAAADALGIASPGDALTQVRYMLAQPLQYTAGKVPAGVNAYSNFGYQVLGRVIARKSGKSLEETIRQAFFVPVGATRTRVLRPFYEDRLPGEVVAYPHPGEGTGDSTHACWPGWVPGSAAWRLANMDAAGGFASTAVELVRYLPHFPQGGAGAVFGGLPGISTTLAVNGNVNFSLLFNRRPQHPTGWDPHGAINKVAATVGSWPGGDLYRKYMRSEPRCSFRARPTSASVSASAGRGKINVISSGRDCGWSAVSNAPWLTIASDPFGVGNGRVEYHYTANHTSAVRVGRINVAGRTVTVSQSP